MTGDKRILQDRNEWESQYESGKWDLLSGDSELAHYSVVAGFIRYHRSSVSLLDIGCGEGVILDHLHQDVVQHYTGVDIAQAALNRVQQKRKNAEVVCSTLE